MANTVGYGWLLVPYMAFLLLTMALLVTDLEEFRIVDRLNLRGSLVLAALLTAVASFSGDGLSLRRAFLGAAAYFAGALALYVIARGRGFGGGDVKVAAQLGLFTAFVSWGTLGWAVFSTALIGGVLAIALVLFGSAGRNTEMPYGPPMIIGAWLAVALAGVGAFPVPS